MTEEEARDALFKIHWEYMKHSPKERLELYDEYVKQRAEIQKNLRKAMLERKQNEQKIIR